MKTFILCAVLCLCSAVSFGQQSGSSTGGTTTPGGSGSGGTPSGSAGGDLGGTYPNPTVVSVAHVNTGNLAAANNTKLAATAGVGGFIGGTGGNLTGAATATSVAGGTSVFTNNELYAYSFQYDGPCVPVGHITNFVVTGVAGSVYDTGLYPGGTATTLLVNQGSTAATTSSTVNSIVPTQGTVTVCQGVYWFAQCGNSSGTLASVAWSNLVMAAAGAASFSKILNNRGTRYGHATSACTAGVLPGTLPTLTADNAYVFDLILTQFEP